MVAQRVFHTRLLPHLLVTRGLPKVFHKDADSMRKQMDSLPLITDAEVQTAHLIEPSFAIVDYSQK